MPKQLDEVRSHLYVMGEVEEPTGPVKIGLTTGRLTKTGRANMGTGNWRTLEVLGSVHVHPAELRWREWLTHRNLRSRHVHGEWFDVRDLQDQVRGWRRFLDLAYLGDLPGCVPWKLGGDGCRLESMARLTEGMPRQFSATCSCGKTVTGAKGEALETVLVDFAVGHLKMALDDPEVVALKRRKLSGDSSDEG